ncbi:MAG TPA: quinone oxidoreductase [Rhodocyclaceae bacterium]|nr:quinone oxidoreductase [Rhodocyclaceae bacterium]
MTAKIGVIRIHQTGGPEVLQWEEVAVPPPGPGEVTLQQEAVGLNFVDIYVRTGLYPAPLPSGLGQEGAGVVTAVGEGVTDLRVGDRVAYAGGPLGAYAEVRNMPAQHLVRLPDGISTELAAAMLLRGLTAQYLLRRTYRVQSGDPVLIHSAAGGVGMIAAQWAKALGAHVIGTVGSAGKAELARSHGCDEVIILGQENLPERVKALTGGEGVAVAYDAVGKDTFFDSLDSIRPLGMMVSFGNASGPVPPISVLELSKRGSLFLTRPSLFAYTRKRGDLLAMAEELFDVIKTGKVKIEVGQSYALQEAGRAQTDLAERRTTGCTVLLP